MSGKRWPGYGAVWRWHFYAGLFCIPFVMWLAATGSIYLFKNEIEAWVDRPYEHLEVGGRRAMAREHVSAALAAVPGGLLNAYELPVSSQSAVRILVGRGPELLRVYVHPHDLTVLNIVDEDTRPMRRVFLLHGELLMGERGSMMVELAASWAIVMILSGLFLWWPRGRNGMGGIVYPRLGRGGRVFWRDIHAVVGVWISFFTLFLLISGLPWAKSWGGMLKTVRAFAAETAQRQDWTTSRSEEAAERTAMHTPAKAPGEHDGHGMIMGGHSGHMIDYTPIDRLAPVVANLGLAHPVLVSPPSAASAVWTARSDAPNRPLRTNITLDAEAAAVTARINFRDRPLIDRLVGIGVAAHEGQLFGRVNQALGLFTALGLLAVGTSGAVMWWRRKPAGSLGAPPVAPATDGRRISPFFVLLVVAFGMLLPMLGLSLLVVLALDRYVVTRMPGVGKFMAK